MLQLRGPRAYVPIGVEQLGEISRIAREDCDLRNWAEEASVLGKLYLLKQRIRAQAVTVFDGEVDGEWRGFLGFPHSWIELPDGRILDPTISRFAGMTFSGLISVDSWPCHPQVPDLAVVSPGDPFALNYRQ